MTQEKNHIRELIFKWVGPVGGTLAIAATLFAGMRYIIKAEVADSVGDIKALREDISSLKESSKQTDDNLTATNQRIDGLLKDALERTFPTPTATKTVLRGSLAQTNKALQVARAQNIKLNPALLEIYGKQIAEIANEPAISDAVWHTETHLADYRTILNREIAGPILATADTPGPAPYLYFSISAKVLKSGPETAFGFRFDSKEFVPHAQAALYEEIDKPDPTPHPGPKYLVVEGRGVEILLDGNHLRNVIIHDVQVNYDGGPLILENVYFVNCTFHLSLKENTRQLTTAVLASPATNYQAS